MHRRSFLQQSALAFGALTLAHKEIISALFQEPWKITMLRKDFGIYTERGGTIAFLLSKEGIVVVDSQFPEQSKRLISELQKKSEKPFRLLINTHHHGDHSGGNISFKGLVEHVLAHANSKINQQNASRNKNEDQQLFPDQVYTHIWCEKTGKENICLRYFGPAHTNGDSLVHFQHANIVHLGDLLFNRRQPFIDRAAGASMKNWITVLDKALETFDKKTIYIYGHAAPGFEVTGNGDDLKKFRDFLGRVLKFTEEEIRAGKTKEEILKATAIPGETEWNMDNLQRTLQAAYEELTAK